MESTREGFDKNIYYGCIIKGDLIGAISYVKQFPEQTELYDRYMSVFEQGKYPVYGEDVWINEILGIYYLYYKDAFYLCISGEKAEDNLRARLAAFLDIRDDNTELCEIEQKQLAGAFHVRGFYFLGGRTSGYYGPYIWKTTEYRTYEVELPDGVQNYTVKLLDDFISKSWMDFLSFGELGTGGWSDGDGIINCVKSSYDFDSEDFKVSLLKHEAQHTRDLLINKDMTSENLEYRAKLVELIYSSERNLLIQFIREADDSGNGNGHTAAAKRIAEGFSEISGKNKEELESLPIESIQNIAKMLFAESLTIFVLYGTIL